MNEYSDMNFVLGAIGFICVLWAISKIGSGSPTLPDKPKTPEPLTNPQRAFHEMPEANFDSNAFQAARQIIMDIERHPDAQSKTLALAGAIHRMDQYRARQTDRMTAEQRKEQDIYDKALALADRLAWNRQRVSAPPPPPPPQYNPGRGYYQPEQPRINNYHARNMLTESGTYDPEDDRRY